MGGVLLQARSDGRAKLVDDEDLQWVHPPRCDSIGCTSKPYGPARVEVHDESGALVASALTNTHNHCAISGLTANTRYTYSVTVKHELWGAGVRWDWDPQTQGLVQRDRVYRNEFRTLPDPTAPLAGPFSFIVIGDFGVGIRKPSTATQRQYEVAQALERAVDEFDARLILTTGDNIYASKRFLLWTGDSGDEDDDWFFTYFQPYRYVLESDPGLSRRSAITTRGETEEHDDREQVMDNMYLRERLAGEEAAGRASVEPGLVLPVPGVIGHRVRLHRHVEGGLLPARTALRVSEALGLSRSKAFPAASADDGVKLADPVRTPSAVLRGAAAPQHARDGAADRAVPARRRPGALQRARAQLPALARRRDRLLRLWRRRQGPPRQAPNDFESARTPRWSGECHFLVATIDGDRMTVRAIGESPGSSLVEIARYTPSGELVTGPIVVG